MAEPKEQNTLTTDRRWKTAAAYFAMRREFDALPIQHHVVLARYFEPVVNRLATSVEPAVLYASIWTLFGGEPNTLVPTAKQQSSRDNIALSLLTHALGKRSLCLGDVDLLRGDMAEIAGRAGLSFEDVRNVFSYAFERLTFQICRDDEIRAAPARAA